MSVRRILVGLDGSPESRATLAAAARLGVATGAELHGLFVEDIELLRLAGLPFAREAGVASGVFQRLETSDIERRFRVAAEKARATLHEAASTTALRSTFRVTRGLVVPELLAGAREADVIAAGKRRGHGPAGGRLGGTARGLLAHVRAPVLVGGSGSSSAGPAVVICATPDVPHGVLGFVTLLARAFEAPEVVVIAGEGGSGRTPAEPEGIRVRRRTFPSISSGGLKALPEIAAASTVVLVRPESSAGHELLVALTEAVACPVFVIDHHGLAELLSA